MAFNQVVFPVPRGPNKKKLFSLGKTMHRGTILPILLDKWDNESRMFPWRSVLFLIGSVGQGEIMTVNSSACQECGHVTVPVRRRQGTISVSVDTDFIRVSNSG